jgi:hypothetical protein
MIFKYSISTNTFIEVSRVADSIKLNWMARSADITEYKAVMVGSSSTDGNIGYILKTLTAHPYLHELITYQDIDEYGEITLIEEFSISGLTTDTTNPTIDVTPSTLVAVTLDTDFSNIFSYTQQPVAYYVYSADYPGFLSGNLVTSPISLTCTADTTLASSTSHTFISGAPDWVTLDTSDTKLIMDIPPYAVDTDITFTVLTDITYTNLTSKEVTKEVTIGVIASSCIVPD